MFNSFSSQRYKWTETLHILPALLSGTLLLNLLVSVPAQEQPSPDKKTDQEQQIPERPSFTGFLQFRDGTIIYGQIERTGYDQIQVELPDRSETMTCSFEELPTHVHRRVQRKLLLPEKKSPPQIQGVRITQKYGPDLKGVILPSGVKIEEDQSNQEGETGSQSQGNKQNKSTDSSEQASDQNIRLKIKKGVTTVSRETVENEENTKNVMVNPFYYVDAETAYQIMKKKHQENNAADQWTLGVFCFQSELYDQAVTHFNKSKQLNSQYTKAADLRIDILQHQQ